MTPDKERNLLRLAAERLRTLRQENAFLRAQLRAMQLRLQLQMRKQA